MRGCPPAFRCGTLALLVVALALPAVPLAAQGASGDRGIDPIGFSADLYDYADLAGFVLRRAWDQPLDFELICFGESFPYPTCKLVPELADGTDWSVHWSGELIVPETGSYTFRLLADDGARLVIDGHEVVDKGWRYPLSDLHTPPQTVTLTAGRHAFYLDYEQRVAFIASLRLLWQGPGFAEEVVPLAGHCEAMQVAPGVASGLGWSLGYEISLDDGMVLHDVRLGDRLLAERVSIPYFELATNLFPSRRFELTNSCDASVGRSRLVGFQTSSDASRVLVEASYLVDRLPGDPGSQLEITQHYEFRSVLPEGGCEPSHEIFLHSPREFPCNPYKLTVHYRFLGTGGERVLDLQIPERIHFQVDGAAANAATVYRDRDDLLGSVVLGPVDDRQDIVREGTFSGLVGGEKSEWDNYHQTSNGSVQDPGGGVGGPRPGQPVAGCPECAHMHWRWGAVVPNPEYGNGKPLIPRTDVHFDGQSFDYDSNQDLDGAVVRFHPGEEDPASFSDLLDGEGVRHENMVFWYLPTGHLDEDSFFIHFGFFSVSYVDLVPSISDSPDPAPLGADVTYRVTVRNLGTGRATGVRVVFLGLSGVASLAPGSDRGCTQDVFDVTCSFDRPILSGGTDSFQVVLRPRPEFPTSISVSALVSADQVDFNEDNDRATEETRFEPGADLGLDGSATPDRPRVGGEIVYRWSILGSGPASQATGVRLTAELPDGADLVSASGSGACGVDGGRLTCQLGTLPLPAFPGAAGVTVVLRPTRPGRLDFTAQVGSDTPDFDASNNVDRVSIIVRP